MVDVDSSQGLSELRWHWGSAYSITHPEPDLWIAQRKDDHATLRAESAYELRDKILGDYLANPVSRVVAP